MPADADYYALPNGTLKNKLGLTSQKDLQTAEDQITAARAAILMTALPKPPFTFNTLRQIHRELFQDVYDWAGQSRTGTLAKKEFEGVASPVQSFAPPGAIEPRATALFAKLADANFLANTSPASFAAGATDTFVELNAIHFAREGNGRTQRLLLNAMAANAGHTLSFDIITHERMVAVSIAAHKGETSGVRRMFDEALDPRQVEAMRKAIGFLKASGRVPWNNHYIATTRAGRDYTGVLVGPAGPDFMFRGQEQGEARILIGDVRDLPTGSLSGSRINFKADHFAVTDEPSNRPGFALNTVLSVMQAPGPDAPPPWEPAPIAMAERVRAFEAKMAEAKAKPKQPDPEPDQPRPKTGPRP